MEKYKYRGRPISFQIMKDLICEKFANEQVEKRANIIKICEEEHVKRGGTKSEVETTSSVFKSVVKALIESGDIESAGAGYWRRVQRSNKEDKLLNFNKLYDKQNGLCNACKQEFKSRNLTLDQIIPRGGYHIGNLQLLCGACNSVKGDRSNSYLLDKLKQDGIS